MKRWIVLTALVVAGCASYGKAQDAANQRLKRSPWNLIGAWNDAYRAASEKPSPQAGTPPQAPQTHHPPLSPIDQTVKQLMDTGLVKRINHELNEAFVEPAIWHVLTVDQKEGVGRILAFYCGAKKGTNLNWVEIRDIYSGKRLAKYSQSWGFKVY